MQSLDFPCISPHTSSMNRRFNPYFSLEWLFYAPPALHIISQIYTGFLFPGFLTLLAVYWTELTRAFWEFVLSFIDIPINGLERAFDALTLILMLGAAGLGSRFRRDHIMVNDRTSQKLRDARWPGVLPVVQISIFTSLLVMIFSNSLMFGYSVSKIMIFTLITSAFSFILYSIYLLYDRSYIFENKNSIILMELIGKLIILSGLIVRVIKLWAIIVFIYIIFISFKILEFPSHQEVQEYSFSSILLAIAVTYIHYALRSTASIEKHARNGEIIIAIIMICICYAGVLGPFMAGPSDINIADDEVKAPILLLVILLFPVSIIFCIRTNRSLLSNIFIFVCVLVATDQLLSLARHGIESYIIS